MSLNGKSNENNIIKESIYSETKCQAVAGIDSKRRENKNGGSGRTRTCDQTIMSRLL